MNELYEVAKYLVPLIVLLICVLLILRHFSEKEKTKQKYDLIRGNNKLITPIRLQAYERIILFLERIKPDSMALRIQKPSFTAVQIQILMLETVRKEFNHNLSQQVYLTQETWAAIVNSKEQVIRLINLTGTTMEKDGKSNDFVRTLIEMYNDLEIKPIENTIRVVKKEAASFFGM
jgi:hypothetical protein